MIGNFGKRTHVNKKDQFYTDPGYAKKCVGIIDDMYTLDSFSLCVEPSAGKGSFSQYLPENSKSYDIDPKQDYIINKSFFNVSFRRGNILVIGNPPFGRVSSTAIKFFNHAARFAGVIAFIIPQTFHRISVQNKLDLNFHIVYNEDIIGRVFEPDMAAKCSFQIWERKDIPRKKVKLSKIHKDWEFLPLGPLDENNQPTVPKGASFAFRAYGSNVGEIRKNDLKSLRPKSWHWIKTDTPDKLISRFSTLDYSVSEKTVRQCSLGRGELVFLYSQKYK